MSGTHAEAENIDLVEDNGSGDVNIQNKEAQDTRTSTLSAEGTKDNTEIECKICGEKVLCQEMKNHKKTKKHISNQERIMKERGDEEIHCKVCGDKFLRKNMSEHQTTIKHIEAQKEKFGESECEVCKEKYVTGCWKEHKKTKTHILIEERAMKQSGDEEIQCRRCKGKYLRKNLKEHKTTLQHMAVLKHIEALKQKNDENYVKWCALCNEECVKRFWKEHTESETHILMQKKKMKGKVNEKVQCKICGEELLRKNMKKHKASTKHIEALKQIFGERKCDVCKEKYVIGRSKEHNQTESHMLKYQQKQEKKKEKTEKKAARRRPEVAPEKELYTLRPASEENQQYINTLTTYFAVRYALNTDETFVISVNDDRWNHFGDIVIEIIGPEETKIEAIRCTKTQQSCNYTILALGAESGNLSLKEQCEILKNLSEKKSDKNKSVPEEQAEKLTDDDKKKTEDEEAERDLEEQNRYKNTNFRLFTVSNILLDHNPRYIYDDEVMKDWQNSDAKQLWKDRKVEIKQSPNKNKDLFDTTDDADNVCVFDVSNHQDERLNNDLKKFHLYINQKRRSDLQAAITRMIKDKFAVSFPFDISDDLIDYIRKKFKTDKVLKKDERNYKLTKDEVLLKISELLLAPYLVFPQRVLREKSLDSWNKIIQQFDITVIGGNEDLLEKVYEAVNYVLKEKTKYSFETHNNVKVDTNNVEDKILKSNLIGYDRSLQFLYFALWKSGLAPLVLSIDNEDHLKLICSVASFLKSRHFLLKIVITTSFRLTHIYFPKKLKLKVFLNLRDLKILSKKCLGNTLDLKFKFLDSERSLKEIDSCNEDFLEKLTPDALLNICLNDFSFMDVSVPMTTDIVDNTLVFEEKFLKKIQQYFRKRDGSERESKRELTYLVSVQEIPNYIQVPPEL